MRLQPIARDTERHLPCWITQCYLPPDTGERAPLPPQPDRLVVVVETLSWLWWSVMYQKKLKSCANKNTDPLLTLIGTNVVRNTKFPGRNFFSENSPTFFKGREHLRLTSALQMVSKPLHIAEWLLRSAYSGTQQRYHRTTSPSSYITCSPWCQITIIIILILQQYSPLNCWVYIYQPAYIRSLLKHCVPSHTLRSLDSNLLSCPRMFWFS